MAHVVEVRRESGLRWAVLRRFDDRASARKEAAALALRLGDECVRARIARGDNDRPKPSPDMRVALGVAFADGNVTALTLSRRFGDPASGAARHRAAATILRACDALLLRPDDALGYVLTDAGRSLAELQEKRARNDAELQEKLIRFPSRIKHSSAPLDLNAPPNLKLAPTHDDTEGK